MHKRLFIALPLPREARSALSKYRDAMGRETPYLRWAPVQNLHITALFLGEVAGEDTARVEEAIARVCAKAEPFSLLCGGACYAPPQRPLHPRTFPEHFLRHSIVEPHHVHAQTAEFASGVGKGVRASMVWLIFDESRLFSECARRLADAVASLAPAMDWKPWKAETPHVTVARFQEKVLPHKLRRLRLTSLEYVEIPISSCELMESQLTPAGPIYRLIREYPLTS